MRLAAGLFRPVLGIGGWSFAMTHEWTPTGMGNLLELWEGHSTAEIGLRVGETKNSVVGKAEELELSARIADSAGKSDARPPAPCRCPQKMVYDKVAVASSGAAHPKL